MTVRLARRAWWLVALAIALCPAPQLKAQCSACRDNTAGSAPEMRQGLRKAIPILGIPAVILFTGILVLASRTHKD